MDDLELEPVQPEEVARAVADLLRIQSAREPDLWWQAGIDEALSDDPADQTG